MYDFPREYRENKEDYLEIFDSVCETAQFSGGTFVRQFERDFSVYIGANYTASVSNGTSALLLALRALDIGPGDEVIVPSATFTATPGAVLMCGARPIFADIEPDTWQIALADVEKRITKKTKAVIGVHLYGGMFDVEGMAKLCQAYGLPFVEDTAQAVGSELNGKKAGTFGAMGCYSFYPTKNLGSFGEGGCVVSENAEYIARINSLKEHDKRNHESELGYNMRMEGIQGAVLSYKLKSLDVFTQKKISIARIYRESLRGADRLVCQKNGEGIKNAYHLFVVKTDDRERFMAYMDEKGIETGVQYPVPCHQQKVFTDLCGCSPLPVTEDLFTRCVSVPIYPYLSDEEISCVAAALSCYGKHV